MLHFYQRNKQRLMGSSRFLELWVSDDREYDLPTFGTQFLTCSVKDLKIESRITKRRDSQRR
jgi:hypothetical protein